VGQFPVAISISELLTPEGLEIVYHNSVNYFRDIVVNKFKFNFKTVTYPLVVLLALETIVGCAPPIRDNYLKDKEAVLQRILTKEEVEELKRKFKQNPEQHSQEVGNYVFSKMYKKSPQFVLEFAQTSELNDGINPQEARAMMSIYNLIKDLKIPPDLFEEKEDLGGNTHKIIMEWHGNKEGDWSGWFLDIGNSPHSSGRMLNVKPIGFEQGDKIDDEFLKKYGELQWESMAGGGDTDGLIVTLVYPTYRELIFYINNRQLSFIPRKTLTRELVFNEKHGLEGKLIIGNAYKTNLTPELFALKEMVLAGKGDYKFSAPLQALLWGYMDGKFKEADNPFKNYQSPLEFVKPIWGDMEGPRWTFDKVVDRLSSDRRLLHYYNTQKIIDQDYRGSWKSPKRVFKDGSANCYDTSKWNVYVMKKGGRKTHLVWVHHPGSSIGHIIMTLEEKKNEIYVLDKDGPNHFLRGPFTSVFKIPYLIRGIIYGTVNDFV